MTFTYQRNSKTIEVLNDLLKIHNDRIDGYNYAINQSTSIAPSLSRTFEEIIADSSHCREQLSQKIKELNGNPLKVNTLLGKIYQAWTALKVNLPCNTQKAIMAACLYNEKIALHAYNAALSSNLHLTRDICDLIQKQHQALTRIYTTINNYRESRQIADQRLVYFV